MVRITARSLFALSVILSFSLFAKPQPLMLANVYQQGIVLDDYWVSEKYDGVRAFWDGKQLWSRSGHLISAPQFFTEHFPTQPLDGELWIARQQFARVSGIVRTKNAGQAWRQVKFMVFDLPKSPLTFDSRLVHLTELLQNTHSEFLKPVEQFKVATHQQLMLLLDEYIANGSEGLMLHKGSALYHATRSDDLLKLKRFVDADAVVIEHIPGKGKYKDMMGALLVKNQAGQIFKIGTGFSDQERQNPPKIGSVISYKYTGYTKTGLPRFAVYLREKLDAGL